MAHVCSPGCCAGQEDSAFKAGKLIQEGLLRAVSVPALNKWTKVFPCVGAVVLIAHFHHLAPDVFKSEFGALLEQEEQSASDEQASEDKGVGVPVNEVQKWRRLARKRNKKALAFLTDPECRFVNMMWVHIAAPVMRLHWSLFRNATWFSDRPEPGNNGGESHKDKMHQIAAFCEPKHNPALEICEHLLRLLTAPSELQVLCFFYGNFGSWSQERKRAYRMAVLVTMGQLIRKLVEPFLQYPWRLFPLCGKSVDGSTVPREARQQCVDELLQAPSCCCDPGFAGRLKRLSAEELLDDRRQAFLEVVFSRVVLTSTFIERKFANFKQWTDQSQKPLSLQLLAAKHYTRSFSEAAASWRNKSGFKPGSKKGRPSWCGSASKASRLNGFLVFEKEQRAASDAQIQGAESRERFVKKASEEWRALPPAQKQRYSQKAQAENARSDLLRQAQLASQPAPLQPGGPWNLSFIPEAAGETWPLHANALGDFLRESGGFRPACQSWAQAVEAVDINI